MLTRYDKEADAFYVRFVDVSAVESDEVFPGLIFDYDADGRIVGMEVLSASCQLAAGALPSAAAE